MRASENTSSTEIELQLDVLTGIHIGSGLEIDPLSYLVRQKSDASESNFNPVLCRYDLQDLIPLLTEAGRDALIKIIDRNDLKTLRREVVKAVCSVEKNGRPIWKYCCPTTAAVSEAFDNHIDDTNNQLLVNTMTRAGSALLIPCSSAKGALRTAVLQARVDEGRYREVPSHLGKRPDEAKLLSYKGAQADPLRALRISDAVVAGDDSQLVCRALLWKRNGASGSPQLISEVARGVLLNGDAKAKLQIRLDNRAFDAARQAKLNDWAAPGFQLSSITELLREVHRFYSDLWMQEYNHFYLGADEPELKRAGDELNDLVSKLDSETEFLVRLGRFSQKESVTLRGAQKPLNFGRSRTLLEYQGRAFPAGWAVLRLRVPEKRKRVVVRTKRT